MVNGCLECEAPIDRRSLRCKPCSNGLNGLKGSDKIRNTIEKFWTKVDKESDSGCWLWTGKPCGLYGYFRFQGKPWEPYRLAWTLIKGSIPSDKTLCHTCDTPLCVKPAHLYLGSKADNFQDFVSRHPERALIRNNIRARGEAHPASKLRSLDVIYAKELRRQGHSYRSIAYQFNVSRSAISNAIKGTTWKELV